MREAMDRLVGEAARLAVELQRARQHREQAREARRVTAQVADGALRALVRRADGEFEPSDALMLEDEHHARPAARAWLAHAAQRRWPAQRASQRERELA